ncbi:MAG TPA: phasin family protein [Alphaproteobacteria bacterium]|nr:phasin family protein [Alphaproteobacteria bacterium]
MSNTPNFPFFENEFVKAMTQFRVPTVDVEMMVTAQRKNVEAFTAANRLAIEGIQAVMRRQLEIFRQTVEESSRTIKDMATTAEPNDRLTKQVEMLRSAYDQALSNMNELTDMLQKSNTEAAELIQTRVSEAMGEVKKSVDKKAGKPAEPNIKVAK